MIRPLSLWLTLLGTSLLPAQDPSTPPDALATAKQRLAAALQKTAAVQDVGFVASWGPDPKPKADDAVALFAGQSAGNIAGSWHGDLRHYTFDGDNGDQILVGGGRTIARDKDRDWRPRNRRFADGNIVEHLADVALLLQQLAAMDLAVVARSVGSLDDRPVETVTVTLNPDQITEAAWSGIVPPQLLTSGIQFQFAVVAAGAAQRQTMPAPDATVDVAIAFDPATSLIQQIRLRSWTKNDGHNQIVFGGGAGMVQVIGGATAEDEEPEEEPKLADGKAQAAAPMAYENGLPLRPRKNVSVKDYTVRLTEHGAKKAPELTDAQKQLLGR